MIDNEKIFGYTQPSAISHQPSAISHQPSAISHPIFLPFSIDANDVNVFHVLFFLKGFLWFNVYKYGGAVNKLLDCGIVFFYLFEQYKHARLRFNQRFMVLVIFAMLWLIHLSLTGFLEAVRAGYIRTIFYRHHMVKGAYAVKVRHMIYGSFLPILKMVIKYMIYIYCYYVIAELLAKDKKYSILRSFTWGNMIALPLVLVSLYGRSLFSEGLRFAPEIVSGSRIHPNTVGALFLFAFFANMLTYFREKIRAIKICHIFYCVMCVCFILFAGARSCAVCLLVAFTFMFFTVWRKHLLPVAAIAIVFVLTLSFALNFMISSGELNENPIFNRMSIERAEKDGGSGRLDTWWNYYKHTSMKQFLIGVGPLATTSTIFYDKFPLRNWSGFISHPSNTYLYMLLTYGIGGFMIFMLIIFKIFCGLKLNLSRRRDISNYIDIGMFLGYCAMMLTGYNSIAASSGRLMFWGYVTARVIKK